LTVLNVIKVLKNNQAALSKCNYKRYKKRHPGVLRYVPIQIRVLSTPDLLAALISHTIRQPEPSEPHHN